MPEPPVVPRVVTQIELLVVGSHRGVLKIVINCVGWINWRSTVVLITES